jgi:hypothetical protein
MTIHTLGESTCHIFNQNYDLTQKFHMPNPFYYLGEDGEKKTLGLSKAIFIWLKLGPIALFGYVCKQIFLKQVIQLL